MKKILYIQVGVGFLYINRNVIEQLKKNHPDHEVELFDILEHVKGQPLRSMWNLLCVLWEYLPDFITLKKNVFNLKYHFLGTTYIFNYFSRLVRKKIQREKYEFVVVSQCLCDASGNGVPVFIYTDHTNLNNLNYRFVTPSKYLRTKRFVELERKAFLHATLVFVMSPNIGNSLTEQYGIPQSKVKLVYAGSNTGTPVENDSTKYSNKNIIFVGKEWERKGGPLLVKAFEKVLARIPDATLTIIGCNPIVTVKNCQVLGELPLPDVARHYAKASVFCMPTVREPFGIVFVEAMFNRLPIVTNNMGATPWLVTRDNGYLIENDVDQCAEALVTLLSNPAMCEAFGEHALRVAEPYTWHNVGLHMAQHIESTLSVKAEIVSSF
jgi:glycosyltransferase involved in cell wall biosynthesis